MQYITEQELRERYKKQPFDSLLLEKNQRLTPGAKQFLTDFYIKLMKNPIKECQTADRKDNPIAEQDHYEMRKLLAKVQRVEAMITLFNDELMEISPSYGEFIERLLDDLRIIIAQKAAPFHQMATPSPYKLSQRGKHLIRAMYCQLQELFIELDFYGESFSVCDHTKEECITMLQHWMDGLSYLKEVEVSE